MGRGRPNNRRLTPDEGALIQSLRECGEADLITCVHALPYDGEASREELLTRAQGAIERLLRLGDVQVEEEAGPPGGPRRMRAFPAQGFALRALIAPDPEGYGFRWTDRGSGDGLVFLVLTDPEQITG